MITKKVVRFAALSMLVVASSCYAQVEGKQPSASDFHLYTVVFGVTIDTDAKVSHFRLVKVSEPLTGSKNPSPAEVPQAFVDAAKRMVESEHLPARLKEGKPSETFVMFLHTIPRPSAGGGQESPFSLGALDGIMGNLTSIELKGQGGQAAMFGKPIGKSAFFFTYYAIPFAPTTKAQCESIVDAEIARCVANFGHAEILSRNVIPYGDQTIVEVRVKSPRSKVLSIRCRLIYKPNQLLALTATTPDDLDPESVKALDKIFDEFHFD